MWKREICGLEPSPPSLDMMSSVRVSKRRYHCRLLPPSAYRLWWNKAIAVEGPISARAHLYHPCGRASSGCPVLDAHSPTSTMSDSSGHHRANIHEIHSTGLHVPQGPTPNITPFCVRPDLTLLELAPTNLTVRDQTPFKSDFPTT